MRTIFYDLTNTIVMKKRLKITIAIVSAAFALILIPIAAMMLIIEPRVKINGFAELDSARLENVSKTISILNASDEPIADSIYDNNKIYTKIGDLPQHTPAAFVAIEDKRFY